MRRVVYDRGRSVATPNESFIQRFATLTQATPRRARDGVLRALDITFASLFLLLSLPLAVPIALLLLATGGPPLFEELASELPAYWQRLVVRPGLTGFAQIRRGYETSMAEKLAHDLEWIADRSVRLYLRTLASTALRVLGQFVRGLAGRGG